MYIPRYNEEKDWDKIARFIRENGFAMLVTVEEGIPVATHIPVELEESGAGNYVLRGHIAKANLQWRSFHDLPTTLVVFTGAHSYISSSWYHTEKVPTWNYMVVHVYGKLRVMTEPELLGSLERLMDKYESASEHPVSVHDLTQDELRKNMKAVVGFEIKVEEVKARYKLSQNKDDADFGNVVKALEKRGDEYSVKIADEMKKTRKIP